MYVHVCTVTVQSCAHSHYSNEHSPLLMTILSTKLKYPTSLQTSRRKTGRSMIEA
jgi:hypothetical protein